MTLENSLHKIYPNLSFPTTTLPMNRLKKKICFQRQFDRKIQKHHYLKTVSQKNHRNHLNEKKSHHSLTFPFDQRKSPQKSTYNFVIDSWNYSKIVLLWSNLWIKIYFTQIIYYFSFLYSKKRFRFFFIVKYNFFLSYILLNPFRQKETPNRKYITLNNLLLFLSFMKFFPLFLKLNFFLFQKIIFFTCKQ